MKLPPALGWAAFVFMALALAVGDFEKADFHSIPSILASAGLTFTGLAGLCLHPPFATQEARVVTATAAVAVPTVPPRDAA